ncbi:MAG: hypothetical protein AVDCRST_MAG51-667 [uncultured Ramlibacter sp.]|uniref:Thioredoxin-like fold domain-containing protein n=1 Tax=uncultured Ramlibacter sp. TaxID=260755 RepID=A0A6J4NXN7_9BURK|nr:MAG: hypothetical protein AVDCRST_MAG51-667 [uncultured Ramlibacter sp.]
MSASASPFRMRRALLLGTAGWLAWPAWAAESTLPAPADLRRELAQARSKGRALVVMVSLHGCPYCKVVRESHLLALRAEGQPVVQVELGGAQPVLDFEGRSTSHRRLIASWGIDVAPTVLFFGPGGREVADRLVGAGIPDFYGAYLEERVQRANRASS